MDERSLVEAVVAAPDEDAPRLVLADWLLEQSDLSSQAHGEYIQVACALAKLPDEPSEERARLVRRASALLAQWERTWLDRMLDPLFRRRVWDARRPEWRFSRGFVESYAVPYSSLHARHVNSVPKQGAAVTSLLERYGAAALVAYDDA